MGAEVANAVQQLHRHRAYSRRHGGDCTRQALPVSQSHIDMLLPSGNFDLLLKADVLGGYVEIENCYLVNQCHSYPSVEMEALEQQQQHQQ